MMFQKYVSLKKSFVIELAFTPKWLRILEIFSVSTKSGVFKVQLKSESSEYKTSS